ncbi:CDC45-like protein [Aureobasidium sp. EXF-3400]|nr:CDC45-like protein [Aureobasidium sp. EXF-12344]KAI4784976.1 CDC45-like protein [Aureobasidium sp. EXF-3400]
MYLPRTLLSHLYTHLVRNTHPLSPPVLILVSLDPDALCACRILTALLKRDYIPHKVQPIAGYSELAAAGKDLVLPLTRQHGGQGGIVVCLGVGGLVDLEEMLALDGGEDPETQMNMHDHGVEVWVVDARRPWNLQNVFGTGAMAPPEDQDTGITPAMAKRRRGVDQGKLLPSYTPGRGGIIVYDDGDIEQELSAEKEAFCALQDMPDIDEEADDGDLDEESDNEDAAEDSQTRKRKTWSDDDAEEEADSDFDGDRPYQRRRSNSNTSIPATPTSPASRHERLEMSNHPSSSQLGPVPSSPPLQSKTPSARSLRRKLLKMKRKHEAVLEAYYSLGTSASEPISSMLYSLASELGREDNDLLWLALVGMSSTELYGRSKTTNSEARQNPWNLSRGDQIRDVLRDEVRRLNPVPASDIARERDEAGGIIPTSARSPTDTSIRLSPEPRFLLIRHWSLYESMLHSPYLSSRLHIWSDAGKRRLHKLLAKMGVSLAEAEKGYTHMDMELKRGLRERLLKFAPMYGLDGLVPPEDSHRHRHEGWGFVRSWGWQACLSAVDVAVITSAILEVGTEQFYDTISAATPQTDFRMKVFSSNYNSRMQALPTPPTSHNGDSSPSASQLEQEASIMDPDWTTSRFFAAYDALSPSSSALQLLLSHVPTAQHLHRAILRTGSALISKHQIRHLRAFRMGVVREGPDVGLFIHPGALVKLATWISEAISVLEAEKGAKRTSDNALVLAALDERRGVYVVVGLGGGDAASGRVRSRAEQKARADKKLAKETKKAEKKAQKVLQRAQRKQARRERDEANGIFVDSDDEASDAESLSSGSDSSDSEDDSEDEEEAEKREQRGYGSNKFGSAFQEVVEETGARVRIDSFEHEVVEVKKEDLSGFLEALSFKGVVG